MEGIPLKKVCIYNIKHNRKMYLTMCKAFIEGLQKHGVHYEYCESLKGIASLPETELAVCFTNAPRTKPIIEKQSFDSNNYLSLDVGRFHTKGITNFDNRNKIYGVDTNTDMKDTSLIYCNLLNNDYITHRYIKNNLKSRIEELNMLDINISPYKENNFVLIPEQIHPEGAYNRPEKFKSHNVTNWIDWARNTCNFIKEKTNLKVRIRRHPNRWFWKDHTKDIENLFKDVEFSYGEKVSLKQDLEDVSHLVTISSKCCIEALLNGSHIFLKDKSSIAWDVSNDLEDINSPKTFDRQQWLNDISYSHWTLEEISNGDYWDYYKRHLS